MNYKSNTANFKFQYTACKESFDPTHQNLRNDLVFIYRWCLGNMVERVVSWSEDRCVWTPILPAIWTVLNLNSFIMEAKEWTLISSEASYFIYKYYQWRNQDYT